VAGNKRTSLGTYVKWYCRPALTKFNISQHMFIEAPISNVTEIRAVGAALIHADRRSDMTKLLSAFRDNANSPEKRHFLHVYEYFAFLTAG
jgi:hypothetical protein